MLNAIFSKTTKRTVGTGDDAEERAGEIAVPFSTDSLFNTIQKQLDFKYEVCERALYTRAGRVIKTSPVHCSHGNFGRSN